MRKRKEDKVNNTLSLSAIAKIILVIVIKTNRAAQAVEVIKVDAMLINLLY